MSLNKDMPLVSVIVPVFNVERYLHRCVDSILRQTYSNLEIILVDDGSPDICPRICDEYAKCDKRVHVIHKKNGGLSDARNVGIDRSTGMFLSFVDSDDYLPENMIDVLMKKMLSCSAEIGITGYEYVNIDGKISGKTNSLNNQVITGYQALELLCDPTCWWFYVPAWGKVYKRKLFENIRFPEGKYNEDQFIMHELFDGAAKVITVNAPLYYYEQRDNSIMSEKFSVKRFNDVEALLIRMNFCLERGYYELFFGTEEIMFSKLRKIYSIEKVDTLNSKERDYVHQLWKNYLQVSAKEIMVNKKADIRNGKLIVKMLLVAFLGGDRSIKLINWAKGAKK